MFVIDRGEVKYGDFFCSKNKKVALAKPVKVLVAQASKFCVKTFPREFQIKVQ